MSAWRWLGCAALICALAACGDDDSGGDDSPILGKGDASTLRDAGPDADVDTTPTKHERDGGTRTRRDGSVKDAEPDAPYNPFDYDAAGDFNHDPADAGPPPDDWSCSKALWNDGYCDCGCSARDIDCAQFSCIDPGCLADTCAACFTGKGVWQPCSGAPDEADWKCDPALLNNQICDCGCGIPDPDCAGQGCSEPGCRITKCQSRNGCEPGVTTDATDDCTNLNPPVLTQNKWTCAWDHYGAGDGCDCGCGALDPDCGGGGCTTARCYTSTCDSCFDESGRPYSCDAAAAGWDDHIEGPQSPSMCNSVHFDANDGCDCGCGGIDPDCGKDGCDAPGCNDSACDRCTDLNSRPIGCAPTEWLTAGCDPIHYGTGDGCDCGCGWPDPDCDGDNCTTAGCQDPADACDVCWDNGGVTDATAGPVKCPGWTCTDDAFSDHTCDCGCGKTDPYCRDSNRASCTKEGCSTAACEVCGNSNGEREQCGGEWSSSWPLKFYGLDGLCDCGAGAPDPDCGKNEGCSEPGCLAKGCDVCYSNNQLAVCFEWKCDPKGFGKNDGCDCGCGAPDPDCKTGQGCVEPGCKAECDTCHDPYGRAVACP